MLLASLIVDATTEVGLVAGLIGIGGFLGHVLPTFQGEEEEEIRVATVRGGLYGIGAAVFISLISAAW